MGAYLSEPVTDKFSQDKSSERLSFGASSMQGWRVSQEDAHNCEIEFDNNVSLFAVYDGHGGAEIAQYCAENLPRCIKLTESYKAGNMAQALEDTFLSLDATLIKEDVLAKLTQMAGDAAQQSDDDENEVDYLHAEAKMPIEVLLAKYQTSNSNRLLKQSTKDNFLRPTSSSSTGATAGCSASGTNLTNATSTGEAASSAVEDGNGDSLKVGSVVNRLFPKSSTDKTDVDGVKNDSVSVTNGEMAEKDENVGDVKESKGESTATCSRIVDGKEEETKSSSGKSPPIADSSDESDETTDDDFDGPKSEDDDDEDDDEEEEEDEEIEGEGKDEDDADDDDDDDDEESSDEDEDEKNEKYVLSDGERPVYDSGCTAVVALIRNDELYVANAGDSRCVVCRKGQAIEMSHDHKPEDEVEKQRIEKAGGTVTPDGRVNGGLNLSRAIGDHSYKNNDKIAPKDQMISALPDIRTLTLDPEEDEFMVVACDGIWNFMNSQEVVDFVRERLTPDREKLSTICEELFDKCLSPHTLGDGTGCDNMTCIIVKFHRLPGKMITKRSSDTEDCHENKRAKTSEDTVTTTTAD